VQVPVKLQFQLVDREDLFLINQSCWEPTRMVSRKGKTRRKRKSTQRSSSGIEMDISDVKEIQLLLQWKDVHDEAWANTMGLLGLSHVKWASPRQELLEQFLDTWEQTKDRWIKAKVQSRSIVIEENVISEMFRISNVGKVEPPTTAFQIANNYMNNIASSGGYCNREGWIVSWMKKPYAEWYAAILQVVYLRRWHTYFSNKTAVTLC
jgi:hypothetical protein